VRTFVAIEVGAPLDAARPTREEAPEHLTLRFLGEMPESWNERISTAIRTAVAPLDPFEFSLDGVGAFPDAVHPRVVWVGATSGREEVVRLARVVSEALGPEGIPEEPEEFVPHVTLFRVRSPRDRDRAQRLLGGSERPPIPRVVRVTEVVVKESQLTPQGPLHRTIARAPLAGRAADRVNRSASRRGLS
jgi:RNA 2',3'-cyclic 3'-phosphodiesterase